MNREVDHAYQSGVEERNEWDYTSVPTIRLYLHGMQGTNCFSFYFLLYFWIVYQKMRLAALGDSMTIIQSNMKDCGRNVSKLISK